MPKTRAPNTVRLKVFNVTWQGYSSFCSQIITTDSKDSVEKIMKKAHPEAQGFEMEVVDTIELPINIQIAL